MSYQLKDSHKQKYQECYRLVNSTISRDIEYLREEQMKLLKIIFKKSYLMNILNVYLDLKK